MSTTNSSSMHSPPAIKSVHQALENYNLLDVRLLQDTVKLDISGAKVWRMNLCALSERDPTIIFAAVDSDIFVYRITPFSGRSGKQIDRLSGPHSASEQHTINQIKLSRIFNEEALVAVTDAGEVWVWRTDQLDLPPIMLSNDGSSTWGIAVHSDQGLIAVSANNYIVTVFNMQSVPAAAQMFGKRRQNIPSLINNDVDKIRLIGHENNIPCVDFSSSGRFLASCSIDQTCRIWDVKTGQQVTERQFSANRIDSNYWCWSVKFVSLRDFKNAECGTEQVSRKIAKRISQERPVTLQSLDLCHSAPNPIYRVNFPELDRGHSSEEELMDSLYEAILVENDEPVLQYGRVTPTGNVHVPVDELRRMLDIYRSTRGDETATSDVPQDSEQTTELRSLWEDFRRATALRWGERVDVADMTLGNEDGDEESSGRNTTDASSGTGISSVPPAVPEDEYQDAEMYFESQDTADSFGMSDSEAMDDHDAVYDQDLVTSWDPDDIDIDSDWFDDGDDEDVVFMQLGRNQGHQLLSAEEHRNLRDRLQGERWSINRPPMRSVQPIPVSTKGGWSDTEEDKSVDDGPPITNALDVGDDQDEESDQKHVIPSVMRSPFDRTTAKKKRNLDLIERLIVTTPKDLFLLRTNTGSMETIRFERGIISNVDVRSDRMLVAMDRLNMVQWIPELELFICASQKGTVALTRMLSVRLSDGQQTIIFNHERYLPDHDMQSKPLYGLSAQRIAGDYGSSAVYILYLIYHDGATLSYRIARQNDELFTEPLVI